MRLGDYLDVTELRELITSRHILRRNHPTLPMAILNYSNTCTFSNLWTDTIKKCRGLIINPRANHEVCDDCQILSLPFKKFFNLNDANHPETLESNLPKVDPIVTEKMDGWFGIMWKCPEESRIQQYGIASRGSFDSTGAKFATQKLQKLVKYGAVDEFPIGYTPIFEIIAKECKIVVDYPFEGLVLLGLVNNETGEELPYDDLQAVWAKIAGYAADNRPWIRLVKAHRMSVDDCITSPKTNFEGFVLSYPVPGTSPVKVKVKLDDYKRLHKLITGVTPQQLWHSLQDPIAPWLEGNVPAHFRTWANEWKDELYKKFHAKLVDSVLLAIAAAEDTLGTSNRRQILDILNRRNPELALIALSLLDGSPYEAYKAIWKTIRPVGREDTFYTEGKGE